MDNNPILKKDPNGDIAIVDDIFIGFFRGLFTKKKSFHPKAKTRFGNAIRQAGRQASNSAKIYAGLFVADKDKKFFGQVWQIGSRFSWELLQTVSGLIYNQSANTVGRVTGVEYYGGATAVKGAGIGGAAVTLGSFISLGNTQIDREANVGIGPGTYTFMHEYGHYRQSQKNGFSYLFKFGIPSLFGSKWTEWDANQRAADYFNNRQPSFTWNPNFYKPGSAYHTYSKLPSGGTLYNAKWWEYFILPIVPILNYKNPK